MTYGHIYIAQVALGADPNQLIKAIKEAEATMARPSSLPMHRASTTASKAAWATPSMK